MSKSIYQLERSVMPFEALRDLLGGLLLQFDVCQASTRIMSPVLGLTRMLPISSADVGPFLDYHSRQIDDLNLASVGVDVPYALPDARQSACYQQKQPRLLFLFSFTEHFAAKRLEKIHTHRRAYTKKKYKRWRRVREVSEFNDRIPDSNSSLCMYALRHVDLPVGTVPQ